MKDSIGSVADENCPARDALKFRFERTESRRWHMTAIGPIAGGRTANVRIRDNAAGHPDIGNDRYAAVAVIHYTKLLSAIQRAGRATH
jgi:hypothetical protein